MRVPTLAPPKRAHASKTQQAADASTVAELRTALQQFAARWDVQATAKGTSADRACHQQAVKALTNLLQHLQQHRHIIQRHAEIRHHAQREVDWQLLVRLLSSHDPSVTRAAVTAAALVGRVLPAVVPVACAPLLMQHLGPLDGRAGADAAAVELPGQRPAGAATTATTATAATPAPRGGAALPVADLDVASSAAQALLLMFPEWRLGIVLQHWHDTCASHRVMASLHAQLPPCDYAALLGCSTPNGAPGLGRQPGGCGAGCGTAAGVGAAAVGGVGRVGGGVAGVLGVPGGDVKGAALLQLVHRLVMVSKGEVHDVIQSALMGPEACTRWLDVCLRAACQHLLGSEGTALASAPSYHCSLAILEQLACWPQVWGLLLGGQVKQQQQEQQRQQQQQQKQQQQQQQPRVGCSAPSLSQLVAVLAEAIRRPPVQSEDLAAAWCSAAGVLSHPLIWMLPATDLSDLAACTPATPTPGCSSETTGGRAGSQPPCGQGRGDRGDRKGRGREGNGPQEGAISGAAPSQGPRQLPRPSKGRPGPVVEGGEATVLPSMAQARMRVACSLASCVAALPGLTGSVTTAAACTGDQTRSPGATPGRPAVAPTPAQGSVAAGGGAGAAGVDAGVLRAAAHLAVAVLMAGPPAPKYGSHTRSTPDRPAYNGSSRGSGGGGDNGGGTGAGATAASTTPTRLVASSWDVASAAQAVGVSGPEAEALRLALLQGGYKDAWLRLLGLAMAWRPWTGARSAAPAGMWVAWGEARPDGGAGPAIGAGATHAGSSLVAWHLQRVLVAWAMQAPGGALAPPSNLGRVVPVVPVVPVVASQGVGGVGAAASVGKALGSGGGGGGGGGGGAPPAMQLAGFVSRCLNGVNSVDSVDQLQQNQGHSSRSHALSCLLRVAASTGFLSSTPHTLTQYNQAWLQAVVCCAVAPAAVLHPGGPGQAGTASAPVPASALVPALAPAPASTSGGASAAAAASLSPGRRAGADPSARVATSAAHSGEARGLLLEAAAKLAGCSGDQGSASLGAGAAAARQVQMEEAVAQLPSLAAQLEAVRAAAVRLTLESVAAAAGVCNLEPLGEGVDPRNPSVGASSASHQMQSLAATACALLPPLEAAVRWQARQGACFYDHLGTVRRPAPPATAIASLGVARLLPACHAVLGALLHLAEGHPGVVAALTAGHGSGSDGAPGGRTQAAGQGGEGGHTVAGLKLRRALESLVAAASSTGRGVDGGSAQGRSTPESSGDSGQGGADASGLAGGRRVGADGSHGGDCSGLGGWGSRTRGAARLDPAVACATAHAAHQLDRYLPGFTTPRVGAPWTAKDTTHLPRPAGVTDSLLGSADSWLSQDGGQEVWACHPHQLIWHELAESVVHEMGCLTALVLFRLFGQVGAQTCPPTLAVPETDGIPGPETSPDFFTPSSSHTSGSVHHTHAGGDGGCVRWGELEFADVEVSVGSHVSLAHAAVLATASAPLALQIDRRQRLEREQLEQQERQEQRQRRPGLQGQGQRQEEGGACLPGVPSGSSGPSPERKLLPLPMSASISPASLKQVMDFAYTGRCLLTTTSPTAAHPLAPTAASTTAPPAVSKTPVASPWGARHWDMQHVPLSHQQPEQGHQDRQERHGQLSQALGQRDKGQDTLVKLARGLDLGFMAAVVRGKRPGFGQPLPRLGARLELLLPSFPRQLLSAGSDGRVSQWQAGMLTSAEGTRVSSGLGTRVDAPASVYGEGQQVGPSLASGVGHRPGDCTTTPGSEGGCCHLAFRPEGAARGGEHPGLWEGEGAAASSQGAAGEVRRKSCRRLRGVHASLAGQLQALAAWQQQRRPASVTVSAAVADQLPPHSDVLLALPLVHPYASHVCSGKGRGEKAGGPAEPGVEVQRQSSTDGVSEGPWEPEPGAAAAGTAAAKAAKVAEVASSASSADVFQVVAPEATCEHAANAPGLKADAAPTLSEAAPHVSVPEAEVDSRGRPTGLGVSPDLDVGTGAACTDRSEAADFSPSAAATPGGGDTCASTATGAPLASAEVSAMGAAQADGGPLLVGEDVCLPCETVFVPAHRMVLAAQSEFFRVGLLWASSSIGGGARAGTAGAEPGSGVGIWGGSPGAGHPASGAQAGDGDRPGCMHREGGDGNARSPCTCSVAGTGSSAGPEQQGILSAPGPQAPPPSDRSIPVFTLPEADVHVGLLLLGYLYTGVLQPQLLDLVSPPMPVPCNGELPGSCVPDSGKRAGCGAAGPWDMAGARSTQVWAGLVHSDDGCRHCVHARSCLRSQLCADAVVLPAFKAACRRAALQLIHGDGGGGKLPSTCLLVLMHDAAVLGDEEAAGTALTALCETVASEGDWQDLQDSEEWEMLPAPLQDAVSEACRAAPHHRQSRHWCQGERSEGGPSADQKGQQRSLVDEVPSALQDLVLGDAMEGGSERLQRRELRSALAVLYSI